MLNTRLLPGLMGRPDRLKAWAQLQVMCWMKWAPGHASIGLIDKKLRRPEGPENWSTFLVYLVMHEINECHIEWISPQGYRGYLLVWACLKQA